MAALAAAAAGGRIRGVDVRRVRLASTVGLFGVHDHWTGGYVWAAAISEFVAVVAGLTAARHERFLSLTVLQRRPDVRVHQH